MPYVLTIATPEARDLIVASLRAAADQRTRVARSAAGRVADEKRAGRDVRSSAVKVTALLAEADQLANVADELAALKELAVLSTSPAGVTAVPIPEPAAEPVPEDAGDDDGLSAEAHRLAELACLEDALVDPDDPTLDTGATAEDEPDEAEEVLK